MIFPDYSLLTCIAAASASAGAFLFAGKTRARFRIPIRCLTAIAFVCAAFLAVVDLLTTSTSPPIYSPDRQRALRLEYSDSGALGGVTFVTLYSDHGFRSHVLFWQEGRTVQPKTLRWITNSEVLIPYQIEDSPHACLPWPPIKVQCLSPR